MQSLPLDRILEMALEHHRAGRLAEAEKIYRQILSQNPDHAVTLHLLGLLAISVGKPTAAVDLIGRAVALCPTVPDFQMSLGNALTDTGRLNDAIEAFRTAVRLKDDFADAWFNLGNSLRTAKRYDEAMAAFSRSLKLKPDLADVHNGIGAMLRDQRRFAEALESFQTAVRLRPDYYEALNNLGVALKELGRIDEAIAAYRHAMRVNPKAPEIYEHLGAALAEKRDFPACDEIFQRGLQLFPDSGNLHLDFAIPLLLRGNFDRGWPEYEWRWKAKSFGAPFRKLTQPQWRGEPLAGKTILLCAEQGLGDTFQFIRYAPLVADRGGKVIVECHASIAGPIKSVAGVSEIVASGMLPPHDVQCPMMSLPLAFGTRVETIPAECPYISPDRALVEFWQKKIKAAGIAKVGLVWAGRPEHANDRHRSIPISQLIPLTQVPDVSFFSLQKSPPAADAFPHATNWFDYTSDLTDFAHTAALIAQLDLIISVDTSVAHLAGAMGKPLWLLLPTTPDWRWMLDRDDSPWYPTARLFRQETFGDWSKTIHRVRQSLANWAAQRKMG